MDDGWVKNLGKRAEQKKKTNLKKNGGRSCLWNCVVLCCVVLDGMAWYGMVWHDLDLRCCGQT